MERDRKIIEFVFEQRVVSYSQITTLFFNGSDDGSLKRLSALVKYGYLSKKYLTKKGRGISFYEITEQAVQKVLKDFEFKITKKNWKSDSIEHDLALARWRIRLQKNSMVTQYISESTLQSCETFEKDSLLHPYVLLNSDAYLQIKGTKNLFNAAFEYEASRKEESRYFQKLKDYYFYNEVGLVIYLCETDAIHDLILKVDGEISREVVPKVYSCSISKLPKKSDVLTFFNRKGGTITIGNIQN